MGNAIEILRRMRNKARAQQADTSLPQCDRDHSCAQGDALDAAIIALHCDWRDQYRFERAMRYMDNNPGRSRHDAYRMADEDVATFEKYIKGTQQAGHLLSGSGSAGE